MEINYKALKLAIKDVYESVELTYDSREEIKNYLGTEELSVPNFSEQCNHEISLVYNNILEPSYKFYSGGGYIPNIFVNEEK